MNRMVMYLLVLLLLTGCTQRTSTSSGSEQESVSSSSASSAVQDAGPGSEPPQKQRSEVFYTGSFYDGECFWMPDGRTAIVCNNNQALWLGLDNRPIREGIYGEPGTQENPVRLTPGEKYVLRTDTLSRLARPDGPDGNWTLTNATLYTLDGEPVHTFPELTMEQAENVKDVYEPYAYPLELYWLGEDAFAANTGGLLAYYNIETGETRMIEDHRLIKRLAYSVEQSPSFGVRQCWKSEDCLYYTVSIGEPPAQEELPVRLMRLDTQGQVEQVLERTDFTNFRIYPDKLLAFRSVYNDGAGRWDMECGILKAGEHEPQRFMTLDLDRIGDPPSDGSHFDYTTDENGADGKQHVIYHRLELDSGEEITFQPDQFESRELPELTFGLYATRRTADDRVEFLYGVSYTEQVGEEVFWREEYWSYTVGDTAPVCLEWEGADLYHPNAQADYALQFVDFWDDSQARCRVVPYMTEPKES